MTVVPPSWSISKSHNGTVSAGQNGLAYTISVNNTGALAIWGAVTVTENPPAGFTLTGMSGTGWSCSGLTCSRSDSLPAASGYPSITATFNVSPSASGTLTNQVSVTGGGSAKVATASDSATASAGQLTIAVSHTGPIYPATTVVSETILVTNNLTSATSGTVTVTANTPGTPLSVFTAPGWNCSGGTTCSRSDPLAVGATYPPINGSFTIPGAVPGTLVNSATVTGGGSTLPGTANDPIQVLPPPVWSISVSHTGNFVQGQTGATYTIQVNNSGAASSGPVTVNAIAPVWLTLTSISGSGWTCQPPICSRSDSASSYPPLTAVYFVATNAPASITNQAQVVGGGASGVVTANDPTTILPLAANPPQLSIALSHSGNFAPGQTNASFTITVSNQSGAGPTNGTVSVNDSAPTGLTAVSMSGTGWTCSGATCTRSDGLTAGSSYPAITATFTVAANAGSPLVNTATISGGGSATASATDSAVINTAPSCSPSTSPSSQNVGATTGAGTLSIGIGPACTWTASSDSWWLTVPNTASNLGPATLPYSYFANNQTTARTANVSVGSSPVFSLTQAGSTQPYNAREVTLLYQAFLNREPDSGGLAYWATQPAQQLGAAFYISGEFQAVQLNLVQLYRAFYGREPDYTTEYLPGVRALRTGANTVAALAGQLVTAAGISSTAQLVASMCANVNPGAAQAVVASCVSANASLLVLAPNLASLQFIASPSYQGVQSSQRDAVFLMYCVTLNRPPDSGGFTYWLNTMTQNSYDNLWLVTAFVISTEFQGRLN